jgi:hypothetical protein
MFARDMRRAVELQGKNSEGIRAMIPRKGSILLPPDLMAPNSRADSTPDSPVLSEQQQRVPTNAMNNSLRQQRLICFRRGASGLVGLKLRKGERPSCGLFFIEDIVPGGAADVSSGFNVGDIVHAVNELQVCLENVLGVFRECASLLEFLVRLCTISTSASCCKIVRQFTPCSPPPPASVASVIV